MATVHGLVYGDNPRDDALRPGLLIEPSDDATLVDILTTSRNRQSALGSHLSWQEFRRIYINYHLREGDNQSLSLNHTDVIFYDWFLAHQLKRLAGRYRRECHQDSAFLNQAQTHVQAEDDQISVLIAIWISKT